MGGKVDFRIVSELRCLLKIITFCGNFCLNLVCIVQDSIRILTRLAKVSIGNC